MEERNSGSSLGRTERKGFYYPVILPKKKQLVYEVIMLSVSVRAVKFLNEFVEICYALHTAQFLISRHQ
jgi:hypothetical protein